MGRSFVITSLTSSAGAANSNPARPLRLPKLCLEPVRRGTLLICAPRELSVVLGERNLSREVESETRKSGEQRN